MKKFPLLLIFAVAIAPCFIWGHAHALLIDDFTVEQHLVKSGAPGSVVGQVPGGLVGDPSIAGGFRESRLHKVSGANTSASRMSLDVVGGFLSLSARSGVGGHTHITYDGVNMTTTPDVDPVGMIGPFDLSADTEFLVDVISLDFIEELKLTLYNGDPTNGFTKHAEHVIAAAGVFPITYSIPLAPFTVAGAGGAAIDLTQITAIRFEVLGDPTSGDITIDHLRTFASPPSVPEPSTFILFGLGVLGILGYGWRRRRETK